MGKNKVFLGIKYYKDGRNLKKVKAIKKIIKKLNFEPCCLVDGTAPTDPIKLREAIFSNIESCDILIFEVSEPSIGVGIETGHFFGKKRIISIAQEDAEVANVVKGFCSDYIQYKNIPDLESKLKVVLL